MECSSIRKLGFLIQGLYKQNKQTNFSPYWCVLLGFLYTVVVDAIMARALQKIRDVRLGLDHAIDIGITYNITGHYNLSVKIIDLVSHTTYVHNDHMHT